MINKFKNFPFTQFMNVPCRTVLKQLLLPAMVTTRALNSALFIIFHTHFCPLQFKVFQGCLKWCIMRLVNLRSQWGEILSKKTFLSLWTSIKELQSLKVESFSMNVLVRKKSICFYNHPSKIFVTFLRVKQGICWVLIENLF